ncbi:MAG: hypothetical protein AWU56_2275 [Idiomarina sp. T82-3]|jgi:hypothetical protein|uniref:hypothetical protein n=1 Tax=Idiomarina baltica TaxID=190892 RepID=UPI000796FA2A|nr:MAG: hypothetical protein AWU56_2275 [Idiomarina sp. T82-3]
MHISIAKAQLRDEFREVKQRLRSTEDELKQIAETKSVSKKLTLHTKTIDSFPFLDPKCDPISAYNVLG